MTPATVGNYRLIRPLGEGGMGVVYEAEHVSMKRRAAVKVLRRELIRDAEAVRRFFNEARATNEVRHPGIVQIYDCGTMDDGAPWLIMEFLDGETFSARMARTGRLTIRETVELGGQTSSVLAAAHAAGILHRDLKPDNLFVVHDPDVAGGERVKVLDFGIAKLGGTGTTDGMLRTKTGIVMGTPAYMSPEQCRGTKQVDARSDIYSLGLILYQMLAGQPPFMSEGIGELFDLHMNVPPPPLRERNGAVGAALASAIHRMLEKDPGRRFQSMAELQQALIAAEHAGGTDAAATASAAGAGGGASVKTGAGIGARTDPGRAATELLPQVTSGSTLAFPGSTTLSASTAEINTVPRVPRSRVLPVTVGAVVLLGGAIAAAVLFRGTPAPVTNGAASSANAPATSAPPTPAEAPTPTAPPAAAVPPTAPGALNAPTAAAGAATVSIDVTTSPTEARVVDVRTGKLLGLTPLHHQVARGDGDLKIRIEKKGYVSRSTVIPTDRDFRDLFKLDKARTSAPQGGERIIKL